MHPARPTSAVILVLLTAGCCRDEAAATAKSSRIDTKTAGCLRSISTDHPQCNYVSDDLATSRAPALFSGARHTNFLTGSPHRPADAGDSESANRAILARNAAAAAWKRRRMRQTPDRRLIRSLLRLLAADDDPPQTARRALPTDADASRRPRRSRGLHQ